MKRSSGILMPISSLPSPYGIGTLGKDAYNFIDFLAESLYIFLLFWIFIYFCFLTLYLSFFYT